MIGQWFVLVVVGVVLVGVAVVAATAFVRALGDDPAHDPPWLVLSPVLYVFRRFLNHRR